jgi:putative ABC transport system substrate-binding protein
MKRREFITLVGGAALAWPLSARAQEAGRTYRLGFLVPAPRTSAAIAAFMDELRLGGFVEGQNFSVVGSFAVTAEQIAAGVAAVVKAAPDAIVCGPELYARALQAATRAIPLVSMSEDLVGAGLAASLAKPGGNITGISLLSPELDGKRQDILIEAVPGARRIAALADSASTPERHLHELQEAARSRGVELLTFAVSKPEDIARALNDAKAQGAEAINVLATSLFSVPGSPNSRAVIERAAELRLPSIFQWPESAEVGGLVGYGPRFTQVYRQRARMIVKVLRGTKAADLPVEQPTNFELIINLKTAKAIGHEVPAALVLRADTVIE